MKISMDTSNIPPFGDHLDSWLEEAMQAIEFYFEDIDFQLDHAEKLTAWVLRVLDAEQARLVHLNFIFCSDPYLHKINLEYLEHDTLTDVITFPYLDPPDIEGDIFISIDRIKENAEAFNVPYLKELYRVMVHGVLHLCGYGDKDPKEEKIMRAKEDAYLEWLVSE